ncbi:MAG: MgtC/SapB family protein [Terracidiphilus sp.]|nr:MgtC/SapB family protein [Terracidiphilus sp.]
MSMFPGQIVEPFNFNWLQQWDMVGGAVGRLLTACLLGGMIGLEREVKRKAAGVRTNLLICMGSAFFTLLSAVLAGDNSDKSRVASNIVQGIGFLGAGLILHNRSRVSGLTSAATVFVVASIGMACGAGLYPAAVAAAFIVIAVLEGVGFLERKANLKMYPLVYEARGADQSAMLTSVLDAMDKAGERLSNVDRDMIGETQRVSFAVTATKRKHEHLRGQLLAEPAIQILLTFRDPEED